MKITILALLWKNRATYERRYVDQLYNNLIEAISGDNAYYDRN